MPPAAGGSVAGAVGVPSATALAKASAAGPTCWQVDWMSFSSDTFRLVSPTFCIRGTVPVAPLEYRP